MFAQMILLGYAITSSFTPIQSVSLPPSVLTNESSVVIVGVVEKTSWVVRRDKMVSTVERLPDGKQRVGIPKPEDYVVGDLARIRVHEVLKNDGRVKTKGIVAVFVHGCCHTEGVPAFVEKGRYLVFLSPLKDSSQTFAGTTVFQSMNASKEARFDPSSKYVVVGNDSGAINLTSQNNNVINEVKALLNRRR